MSVAVVTGSSGLIGSEASRYFADLGMTIVGIDNNMRQEFFGPEASTLWQRELVKQELGASYLHFDADVSDVAAIEDVFDHFAGDISLVIHAAAQPSHDWAANDPRLYFRVNALGTVNLLEATRRHAPDAAFIFTSTNKVYGDLPNYLPLVEQESRWEIDPSHEFAGGINESMSIDQSLHSVFGASKVSADIVVQEYGRYFGLNTACFRCGCLTGPNHSGTKLHGFLAYLMKCTVMEAPYTVFGYQGKQVRDNIHSADLIRAFDHFYQAPRCGEVYNIGGGRFSNCSMLEAIEICESTSGYKLDWSYDDANRQGDHIWWISDFSKFQAHYPEWHLKHDVRQMCQEIYKANVERWLMELPA